MNKYGKSILIACMAVFVSMTAGAQVNPPVPVKGFLSKAEAQEVEKALVRLLQENILPFWYPQVVDREEGGYRLNHNVDGEWMGRSNKGIVTQARTLWFFAHLYRSGYGKPEHLAAAQHGYDFIVDKMWDRYSGGFFWETDSIGNVPTLPDKHLYGQSFALYGLSEYALATRNPDDLEFARKLFSLMDFFAYDKQNAGYRESFLRDWSTPNANTSSYMAAPHHYKLMNTHLHLMESLTAYYQATNDPVARQRLEELVRIQSNSVVRKWLGACTDKFLPDWTPVRGPKYDVVSYGHDIENIWLLIDANETLGNSNSPYLDLYRTLFEYTLRYGYDSKEGGFYNTGMFNSPADDRAKVWWVQAECLVSALEMYRLTGDRKYYDVFVKTLDWINNKQADWKKGDWFANVAENGSVSGGKANVWKGPYHNGRAILRCLKTVKTIAQP